MTADDTNSDDQLPSGWEERATGQGWVYYTNHAAKTTQWEHPVSGKRKVINCRLPYGWETQLDNEGNVYFVDHVNGRTTYADPRLAYATEISSTSGKKVTFSTNSSAPEVLYEIDLKGKVAVITGATSGIGFETAKELAFRGCHVIITCCSENSGQVAVEQMKSMYNNLLVEYAVLDLSSLSSVSSFANRLKLRKISLNILVLNAGVFDVPYSKTGDGLETTFAVNFLSHSFLVLQLLPLLVESTLGRVIFVATESHRFHNMDGNSKMKEFEAYSNPDYKEYIPMQAYNRSKLLMILFCRALQQKLSKLPILAVSVHPGNLICTGLYSKGQSRRFRVLSWLMQPFNKTVSQAAATSCYCATALEVCYYPGAYFNGCRPVLAASECDDPKNQEFVWNNTLRIIKEKTNLEFDIEKGEIRNTDS